MNEIFDIIDYAFSNAILKKSQIVKLLALEKSDSSLYLFKKANEKKQDIFGDKIFIRAIIEFSSYCKGLCKYCGINALNKKLPRYRMSKEEIIATTLKVAEAGYKTVVLQSGEDAYYTADMLIEIIKEIKKQTQLAITLSIGERAKCEYERFFNAGADRFLLKHEVYNKQLYNELHPHSTFSNRINCLKYLKEIGYETGSGFMIGLPKQTLEIIADDILFLKQLGADMAGIGPYICHDDTLLKGSDDGDVFLTLKAVAITRLLLNNTHLPSTTALNIKGGSILAINSGANVIMQKCTPENYRDLYDIYPKRESVFKEYKNQLNDLKNSLKELGLTGE